jgi:hypothetical protein
MDPTEQPKVWWIGNKILKVLLDVNPEPEGLMDPKNQNLKVCWIRTGNLTDGRFQIRLWITLRWVDTNPVAGLRIL